MGKNISDIQKKECTGCGACEAACPTNSISMKRDSEGFLYPCLNKNKCLSCGICIKICLKKKDLHKSLKESECYAAYAKEKTDRVYSSSGGIFYLLAKQVLLQDGVVFGAAFNESFYVEHKAIYEIGDLPTICGSKYIQSDMVGCFGRAKQELKKNRKVLFCGTPCQITGLQSYLGEKYDNLICVSLICYGVPSVTVWKSFLADLESEFNFKEEEIKEIRFRKKYGDKQYFEIRTTAKTMTWQWHDIAFMEGFLKNYYLRPSCYECQEKNMHSSSDIIIGDFWGIDKFCPDLADINAVSACIVITGKGKELFLTVEDIIKIPFHLEDILSGNDALSMSSICEKNIRDCFFNYFCNEKRSFAESLKNTSLYEKRNKTIVHNPVPRRFNLKEDYQYVLWGVGNCFKKNRMNVSDRVNVVCVCDNNEINWGRKFYGLNCVKPEEIKNMNNPFIIIMIENAMVAFSVANQILDMGITNFDLYSNWETYVDV